MVIYVQEDATDFDIVGELERQGVPATDIVLAFHAPFKRPITEYAVVSTQKINCRKSIMTYRFMLFL